MFRHASDEKHEALVAAGMVMVMVMVMGSEGHPWIP